MARSCPCRCWPRYCDGDRARRLSQVPPICGVPPLVLSGCCIDLRMRVVAQRGMGEEYSTNDTAHSLAHTVDSVVYSDSVLHNARLLSRLTTCGAAWWAWATGLSHSLVGTGCAWTKRWAVHTLSHTRARAHIQAGTLAEGYSLEAYLRVSVSAQGYPGPRSHRARRPHTFAATMARSCPCRCWPRYCDGDRARRLSQVPPICGVPPLVLSGCCIDLRMRVVAQRGMGEEYSTNDTAHSLAHTVDSVVYSDSVLHNARLLSRLTTCGAAWWAWATGLSHSLVGTGCAWTKRWAVHTLSHTRARAH